MKKGVIISACAAAVVITAAIILIPMVAERMKPEINFELIIDSEFKATADISYGDEVFTAEIDKRGLKSYSIEITAPSNLQGLRFDTDNGHSKISYKDIEITLSGNHAMSGAFMPIIANVLDSASTGVDLQYSRSGDEIVIEGQSQSGVYVFRVDSSDLSIKSLSVPSAELRCVFS
ncbi:MAG: hypothetical protein FWH14_08195 [Oscillospiraceae bacterium]|nr:hypothetical protein [Oscillospiraceae bacterium]